MPNNLKSIQQTLQTLKSRGYQAHPDLIEKLQTKYHQLNRQRDRVKNSVDFKALSKPIDAIETYFHQQHLQLTGINLYLNHH